jgi:hypothetical protein
MNDLAASMGVGADCLVTRNVKNFQPALLTVIQTVELLAIL